MPGAIFVSATCLTMCSSVSSLHAILTRLAFFASLVTARQRQLFCPSPVRISFSTIVLMAPGEVLSMSCSVTREASIVQYSVSVAAQWLEGWLATWLALAIIRSDVPSVEPDPFRLATMDAHDCVEGKDADRLPSWFRGMPISSLSSLFCSFTYCCSSFNSFNSV